MQRTSPLAVTLLLAISGLLLSGCSSNNQELVVIASPEMRYDHNRERVPRDWTFTIGEATESLRLPRLAQDRAMAIPPPVWVPRGGRSGEDGLLEARLFVLFSGLGLPLSDEGSDGLASDRDDLTDFLGAGSLAKVGLDPGDMAGALGEQVERDYGEILDMLATREHLSNQAKVLAWAAERGADTTFRIFDSRFPETAFKSDRIAVAWGEFWFVLFALPNRSGYSRLVVVPNPPGEQDFGGKTLAGK